MLRTFYRQTIVAKVLSRLRSGYIVLIVLCLSSVGLCFAQKMATPTKVWSVGPLSKGEPVMGISFGANGPTVTGPHVDQQTGSIFAATRSVVFAGDRIVLASRVGMRKIEGAQVPAEVYELLSLDVQTGKVKETREILSFRSLMVFATNDAHVIVSGHNAMRLTPDLKDVATMDFAGRGHKFGSVENISPDGSVRGNATSPGFEMIDTHTLKAMQLTPSPSTATSVNDSGFVTNNPYGYTDKDGTHSINHAACGGRPQFLTNDLLLETGCSTPVIVDIHGSLIKKFPLKGRFSYAGVSQNGTRFALQDMSKSERFVIYSAKTFEPLAEIKPETPGEEQSWTAFSPDGSMFVVGSPAKLALYRLQ
jgi:hypothetical protein